MRQLRTAHIFLLAIVAFVVWPLPTFGQSTPLQADSSITKFDWNFESSIYSRYVWRGFADYSGASWQNTVRVNRGSLGASWWTESGAESSNGFLVREHDFELHYTRQVSSTTLTGGYTAFWTRLDDCLAHELYLTASYGKNYTATASVYQNVGSLTGSYLSAGLAHEARLSRNWRAQLSGTLGFNRKMYIPENTLSDLAVTVGFTRPTTRKLRVSPVIGISKSLNRRYFANYLYTGLVISFGSAAD
jgi:hypothetical protein